MWAECEEETCRYRGGMQVTQKCLNERFVNFFSTEPKKFVVLTIISARHDNFVNKITAEII